MGGKKKTFKKKSKKSSLGQVMGQPRWLLDLDDLAHDMAHGPWTQVLGDPFPRWPRSSVTHFLGDPGPRQPGSSATRVAEEMGNIPTSKYISKTSFKTW
jgi:hypothetical protein